MEQHHENNIDVDKPKHEGSHHTAVVTRSEGTDTKTHYEDESGKQVDEEVDAILELQFSPAEQSP